MSLAVRQMSFAALLVIAAAIGAYVVRQVPPEQEVARLTRVLIDDLGRHRPFEGRVAAGVAHAPWTTARGRGSVNLPTDVRIAIARLEQLSMRAPDSAAPAAHALGELLRGEAAVAVSVLERMRERAPHDASTLVNLSAAYLARGAPGDTMRAFDAALSASVVSPTPESRFNAALAGERLLFGSDAHALWRIALDSERTAGWRQEAEAHAAGLEADRDTATNSLIGAKAAVQDQLSRVLRVCQEGQPAAIREALAEARRVTAQYEAISRHRYESDVLSWMTGGRWRDCHAEAVRAAARLSEARVVFTQDRFTEALSLLRKERVTLTSLGSPMAVEATLLIGTSLYMLSDQEGASRAIEEVRRTAQSHHYLDLAGRAEWLRGFILQDGNKFDLALTAYQAAHSAYVESGAIDGAVAVRALIGGLRDSLGQYADGWREREAALRDLKDTHPSRTTYPVLTMAARTAMRDGLGRAAAAFAGAALDEARRERSVMRSVETTILAGTVALQNGEMAEASRLLTDAKQRLDDIDSPSARERLRARLLIAHAQLSVTPRGQVDALTRAIEAYEVSNSRMLLARLLLARGRAYQRLEDEGRASQDFERGIEMFERARDDLRTSAHRIDYFEEAWGLFDALIETHLEQGRPDRAFTAAERGRANEMRAGLKRTLTDLESATAVIPADATILYYVTLPRDLMIWVLRRGQWRCERVPIERARLKAVTDAFREAMMTGTSDPAQRQRAAAAAYDLLVRPIEREIRANDRVLIAPDGFLASVPFAALWRAESGRYWIEEHEIAELPSVSVADLAPAERQRDAPSDALVVSVSTPSLADSLPALPGARLEAQEVAALYPEARLMEGDQSSANELRVELSRYSVFHFAGHAIVNGDVPGLSRLVISPRADSGGSLYARELDAMDFSRVRIVVLAACQTGVGRTYQSEGVLSLARSFLSRGAEVVLATLWDLQDSAGRTLFREFHRHIRQGHDAAAALRAAQIGMLSDRNAEGNPADWASVVIVLRTLR